ncbi:MAG: NADH-quinone oxidoreductase subunit K [Pseudohongiellaceae bacterium]
MNNALVFSLAGVGLFIIGLHGLAVYSHLLRKVLALNIMGSGVFLVIAGLARRLPDAEPDAVPDALVITGIVVAVAATALALALMLKVRADAGIPELPERERE